jgi:hypothetical protein
VDDRTRRQGYDGRERGLLVAVYGKTGNVAPKREEDDAPEDGCEQ